MVRSDNTPMLLLDGRTSPTFNNSERRRGLRIKQRRAVKVYEPRTSRYFPGQTADISHSGLRLSLPPSIPIIPGSTICLHMGLANTLASRRQMVEAKVIWLQRTNDEVLAGLELLSTAAIQSHAA